jgi:hypothetical protein
MLPSRYYYLESLPLNPAGKLDRGKLTQMSNDLSPDKELTEPANEVEEAILEMWKSILEMADFGVTDDFLVIGGNSIASMKIHSQLLKVFRVKLHPNTLFKHRTVRAVSEELARIGNMAALKEAALFYLVNNSLSENEISGLLRKFSED